MTKKKQSIAKHHKITKSCVKKKSTRASVSTNRPKSKTTYITGFFEKKKSTGVAVSTNQPRSFPHSYVSKTTDLSRMKSEDRVPVVLISLFDGIGGALMALEGMQDEFVVVKAFYSEIDSNAREVTNRYFSDNFVDLGSVEDISGELLKKKVFGDPLLKQIPLEEVLFLVVAGPPCQDLSRAKGEGRKGVLGDRSRLFFYVPIILHLLKKSGKVRNLHFIVENVHMKPEDEKVFSNFLCCNSPYEINSGLSPMDRRRLYWCSFERKGNIRGDSETGVITCGTKYRDNRSLRQVLDDNGFDGYEFVDKDNGEIVTDNLPTLTGNHRDDATGQNKYWIQKQGTKKLTKCPMKICEDLLGFPKGYTDGYKEVERRKLLGNSFQLHQIKYLLAILYSYESKKCTFSPESQKFIRHPWESVHQNKNLPYPLKIDKDTIRMIKRTLNKMQIDDIMKIKRVV